MGGSQLPRTEPPAPQPSEPQAAPPPQPAPPPADLATKSGRSVAWSLLGQGTQVLAGTLSFALLSHWVGPDQFGLLGMASTVSGFLGVFGDTGVTAALTRLPTLDEAAETTGFWVAALGALTLTLVATLSAPVLGWFFHDPQVTHVALALGASFVIAAPARVATARLYRDLAFRTLTSINVGASMLGLAAVLLAGWAGWGVWALVTQTLVTNGAITLLTLAARPVRLARGAFSRKLAGEFGSFGSRLSGFSLAITVGRSLDGMLAGRYLGSDSVGLMSMAIKLALTPAQRICGAVSTVFLPAVLKVPEREQQGQALAKVLRLTTMVVAPFLLGTVAVAPELLLLLPPKWAFLSPVLRVMSVGSLLEPLGFLCVSMLTAAGEAGGLLRVAVRMIAVSWAGAVASVATGSITWVAAAWALSNWIGALWMFALVWRRLQLGRWFWPSLLTPLLAAGAMGALVRAALSATPLGGSLAGLAFGVVLGVVAYALLVRLWMREDFDRALRVMLRRAGRDSLL